MSILTKAHEEMRMTFEVIDRARAVVNAAGNSEARDREIQKMRLAIENLDDAAITEALTQARSRT